MSQPPYEPPPGSPDQPPYQPQNQPPNQPPNQPGHWPPPQPPAGGPPQAPPGYGATAVPPPRKNRTRLIIAGILGALLLVAGVVLAVLLIAGSDGDSEDDSATDGSSSSAPEETEEPSPTEDPTEPTEEPTEEPPAGEVLEGNGYSYTLPGKWRDVTASVAPKDPAGTIDSASAPGASLETTFANLIVEAGPANGETDLEAARDQVARNLEVASGVRPEKVPGRPIAGVETLGLQVTQTTPTGLEVRQDAYVALRDDTYYVIAFSRDATRAEFDEDLEAMLGSWTWK